MDGLLGPFRGRAGCCLGRLCRQKNRVCQANKTLTMEVQGAVNCVLGMTGVVLEVSQPILSLRHSAPGYAPSGGLGRRGRRASEALQGPLAYSPTRPIPLLSLGRC